MENSIAEFKRELFPKNESGIESGIETGIETHRYGLDRNILLTFIKLIF